MNTITLKIEKDLVKKVKDLAQAEFPHRSINKYAEAVREVLIKFVADRDEE